MAVDNARPLYQHLPSGSVLTSASLLLPSSISTKTHTRTMTCLPCKHSAFCSETDPLAQNLIKQRLCGASSHRNKLQLHLMCAYLRLLTQNTYLRMQTESNPPGEQKQSSILVCRWRVSASLPHRARSLLLLSHNSERWGDYLDVF